ncbi:MAG: CoA-binding protein, partial [Candidatus Moranbacteria bacterium]|nr:CoA-binding protein [Candidatus Moranbacteria bacterium]
MNKKNNSSNKSLAGLFYPDAVAVIGASRDKQKIGRQIFDNILRGGFAGPVYPINREGGRIAGHLAYRSISDVPVGKSKKVLAVIAIPAEFVLSEAEKCAARGIKDIIIISAGFKESGAAGKLREEKLGNLALKEGLRILGPNCLGLVSSPARLNATFSAAYSGLGRTVLLSQSGAIGSSALDWLREQNLTFRYFVSLGNKASLGENQIFEYLQQDKDIDLVVAYLEEVDDGQELMSLISRLAKKCPVA